MRNEKEQDKRGVVTAMPSDIISRIAAYCRPPLFWLLLVGVSKTEREPKSESALAESVPKPKVADLTKSWLHDAIIDRFKLAPGVNLDEFKKNMSAMRDDLRFLVLNFKLDYSTAWKIHSTLLLKYPKKSDDDATDVLRNRLLLFFSPDELRSLENLAYGPAYESIDEDEALWILGRLTKNPVGIYLLEKRFITVEVIRQFCEERTRYALDDNDFRVSCNVDEIFRALSENSLLDIIDTFPKGKISFGKIFQYAHEYFFSVRANGMRSVGRFSEQDSSSDKISPIIHYVSSRLVFGIAHLYFSLEEVSRFSYVFRECLLSSSSGNFLKFFNRRWISLQELQIQLEENPSFDFRRFIDYFDSFEKAIDEGLLTLNELLETETFMDARHPMDLFDAHLTGILIPCTDILLVMQKTGLRYPDLAAYQNSTYLYCQLALITHVLNNKELYLDNTSEELVRILQEDVDRLEALNPKEFKDHVDNFLIHSIPQFSAVA